MVDYTRRKFLALTALVAASIIAPIKAAGHHKPWHNQGPKPSPTPTPTPTTTTTPTPTPTTTTPPPPVGTFGPRQGAAAVRAGAGHRPVLAPTGLAFASAMELDEQKHGVASQDIDWDRSVELGE